MSDVLQLLNLVSKGAPLVATAKRAAAGDREALEYIKSDGWADALDVLQPGAGRTARLVKQQVIDAAEGIRATVAGDVIDAEYEVLEGEEGERHPWDGFVSRLSRQRYGAHIVIGEPGSGKTELMKRLAHRWAQESGRRVEAFGFYPDDLPPWAVSMSMLTLVHRMEKLQAYLDAHEERDPDELDAPEECEENEDELMDLSEAQQRRRNRRDRRPRPEPGLPPTERIVLIDEASMSLTTSATDSRRNATIKALANCRHIDWLVVLAAQLTSMVAMQLMGQATIWLKRPSGAEVDMDRQNPRVRELWQSAMEGFERLRRSTWWEQLPDYRAWSYVESPSIGGQPGYRGMVPNLMAPDTLDVEE